MAAFRSPTKPTAELLLSLLRARGYATSAAALDNSAAVRTAFSHCVNQVRTHDYENYLWCIQLPKELRAPILALRAFNVETALIADQAKTQMLVMMRCQWWRDAVNAAFKGQTPEQPTMTALAEVLRHCQLTRYRLQRIVSTREEDMLCTEPPPTLAALEAYAEGTASQLLYLQLEAAGLGGGAEAEHASSHLGKAVGMAALLRGTAYHATRRRTYLPADLCTQHGVSTGEVLGGKLPPGLPDVALAVASAAKAHLEGARALMAGVPAVGRALMLPSVATGLYLSALERCGFDLFHPRLQRGSGFTPLRYQLQLKYHLLRGTY